MITVIKGRRVKNYENFCISKCIISGLAGPSLAIEIRLKPFGHCISYGNGTAVSDITDV